MPRVYKVLLKYNRRLRESIDTDYRFIMKRNRIPKGKK